MAAPATSDEAASYFARLWRLVLSSTRELIGPSSDPHAKEAARKFWRQALLLIAIGAIAVVVSMFAVDLPEIRLMPPRNSPGLWPVRILTDFGKAAFVLWSIFVLLVATILVAAGAREGLRARLVRLATELQYLLLAVMVPIVAGELVKWIVGRGRPFVGPDAFTFSHFSGASAYASFPSAHAITGAALAFAVSALWPRLRVPMIVYRQPLGAVGPPSKRRGRGRRVRGRRRDGRALLVRGPPPRVRDWPRWRHIAPGRACLDPRKGVARGASAP